MFRRSGFITNSSSSSYIAWGLLVSKEYLYEHLVGDVEEVDGDEYYDWDFEEVVRAIENEEKSLVGKLEADIVDEQIVIYWKESYFNFEEDYFGVKLMDNDGVSRSWTGSLGRIREILKMPKARAGWIIVHDYN